MNSVFIGSVALAQKMTTFETDFTRATKSGALNLSVDPSSTANTLILKSPAGQSEITSFNDYESIRFMATLTNTGAMTVKVDNMITLNIGNVLSANQVFSTAMVTLTYIGGAFFVTSQTNPKSGNQVSVIGKLVPDTMDVASVNELVLDGSELSRASHPILWAKVSATSNLITQATKDADPTNYGGFYGDGDGSTTFTLPIYGGEFPRFHDNGRGVDTGRVFGSHQGDAIRNIGGEFGIGGGPSSYGIDIYNPNGVFSGRKTGYTTYATGTTDVAEFNVATFDASRVVPTANEVRSRSLAIGAKIFC